MLGRKNAEKCQKMRKSRDVQQRSNMMYAKNTKKELLILMKDRGLTPKGAWKMKKNELIDLLESNDKKMFKINENKITLPFDLLTTICPNECRVNMRGTCKDMLSMFPLTDTQKCYILLKDVDIITLIDVFEKRINQAFKIPYCKEWKLDPYGTITHTTMYKLCHLINKKRKELKK